MEQMTYEQLLASIDREAAADFVAGALVWLGGNLEWSYETFDSVTAGLQRVSPAGAPPIGDQNDEALKFWGTLALGLDFHTDYEPPMYVATINVPGYLPMDDDPPTFEEASEAWAYLAKERERGEDDAYVEGEDNEYSETHATLTAMSENGAELGSVVGPTPGYDGDHDLGLVYSVSLVEED